MIKRTYRAILLMFIFCIFNIVETAYFGGNRTAITIAEHVCDTISTVGFLFTILLGMYDFTDYFWKRGTFEMQKSLEEAEESACADTSSTTPT